MPKNTSPNEPLAVGVLGSKDIANLLRGSMTAVGRLRFALALDLHVANSSHRWGFCPRGTLAVKAGAAAVRGNITIKTEAYIPPHAQVAREHRESSFLTETADVFGQECSPSG